MKMKSKILVLSIVPIALTSFISLLVSQFLFSRGLYQEIEEGLRTVAISATSLYNSQGYGDYTIKEDGNIWRGMNFNVTESEYLLQDLKEKTGIDIVFYYKTQPVVLSITETDENLENGLQNLDSVAALVYDNQIETFCRKVMINQDSDHIFTIPWFQPDSNIL